MGHCKKFYFRGHKKYQLSSFEFTNFLNGLHVILELLTLTSEIHDTLEIKLQAVPHLNALTNGFEKLIRSGYDTLLKTNYFASNRGSS